MENISSIVFGISLKLVCSKNVGLQKPELYLHGGYDFKVSGLIIYLFLVTFFFLNIRQFLWLGGSPSLSSRTCMKNIEAISCQRSDLANADWNAGTHTTNTLFLCSDLLIDVSVMTGNCC